MQTGGHVVCGGITSLCRTVEAFSFRAEKKRHALQMKVDNAELNMARVKTEYEGKLSETTRNLEDKDRELRGLVERAEVAERRVEDQQRQRDEIVSSHEKDRAAWEETVKKLQEECAAQQPSVEETTHVPSEEMDALRNKLTESEVRTKDLEDTIAQLEQRALSAEEKALELESVTAESFRLKSEVESSKGRIAEFEATEQALRQELDGLRERHDVESAQIQKEAMDTVDAIKKVLGKERERFKKEKEKHASALQSARDTASEQAGGYEKKIQQLENSIVERDAHQREMKRLFEQERTGLKTKFRGTAACSMISETRKRKIAKNGCPKYKRPVRQTAK